MEISLKMRIFNTNMKVCASEDLTLPDQPKQTLTRSSVLLLSHSSCFCWMLNVKIYNYSANLCGGCMYHRTRIS